MAMPRKPAKPTHTTVAEHDAAASAEGRAALALVRAVIAELVPDATVREERLSYGLPTLFVHGTRVVHYAAWDRHLAVYPIPPSPPDDPTLADDVAPFVRGKGTLHFPYAVPLPVPLVRRLVRAHLVRTGHQPTPPIPPVE